jgi:hypothetical protein
MLDHMLSLYVARQRGDRPAELVPDDQDVDKVRASMVKGGFLVQCAEFSRDVYDCTMAATDFAAAVVCAGGDPASVGP